MHAPQGIMSELKLFQEYGASQCLVFCDRAIFRDEEEAARSLARQVCRYVDDLIERNAA